MNFNTDNLGSLGGGTLIFAGLLVLAMIAACRVSDGLGSVATFRTAARQVALSIFINAALYILMGIAAITVMDRGTSKDTVQFLIVLVFGLVGWQIILLGLAVKNLLASLDQPR